MQRTETRSGYTVIEIVTALTMLAVFVALITFTATSMIRRQDAFLAERSLDRVASAQMSHALATGWYAYGAGGSSSDLASKMPRDLTRDLSLTHGEATDTRMVSVAVGQEGSLVLAAVTPERTCIARRYPAPTAPEYTFEDVSVAADEACIASGLLPLEEPPAWTELG